MGSGAVSAAGGCSLAALRPSRPSPCRHVPEGGSGTHRFGVLRAQDFLTAICVDGKAFRPQTVPAPVTRPEAARSKHPDPRHRGHVRTRGLRHSGHRASPSYGIFMKGALCGPHS